MLVCSGFVSVDAEKSANVTFESADFFKRRESERAESQGRWRVLEEGWTEDTEKHHRRVLRGRK